MTVILPDYFALIAGVSAATTLYLHLVKGASLVLRRKWLLPIIFLTVVLVGCWIAHRLLGALPSWPSLAATAGISTIIAANCYQNYRAQKSAGRDV